MKFPFYVFFLRIFRSLVIFCLFLTHLTSLFENLLPDFMLYVLSQGNESSARNTDAISPNAGNSVTIDNVNQKIDKTLNIVGDVVRPIATWTVGGAVIATVIKGIPTPQAKAAAAYVGLAALFLAPITVPAIKALKGSSDKGNGGNNFLAFSMNVVQSDSSLWDQCLTGAHITVFLLEILVILLSVEVFKRMVFDWISKLKNLPKPMKKFVLKSLDKLQSISSVYVAVLIGMMWLNIFNLTVFLKYLQAFFPKTENAALLNTYLSYGLILTFIYFVLTIFVVVILFGNSILASLSKLWFLLEFQVVHMLGRSNLLATQARLLEESNKARQYRLIIERDTLSSRLFLAIVLFCMWVVSLFLAHYYTLFLQCLGK